MPILMFFFHLPQTTGPNQFLYLGRQLDWWYQANGIDAAGRARELSVSGKLAPPTRAGGNRVTITGQNFASTVAVRGIGAGTSATSTQFVDLSFKGSLTLTFTGFAAATDSLGATAPVSITYEFALIEGTGSNPTNLLSGPVTGTDSGINGTSLVYDSKGLVKNGNVRIRRTVSLTQAATGTKRYTATGTMVLSIN